jgi:hypothetical protein
MLLLVVVKMGFRPERLAETEAIAKAPPQRCLLFLSFANSVSGGFIPSREKSSTHVI